MCQWFASHSEGNLSTMCYYVHHGPIAVCLVAHLLPLSSALTLLCAHRPSWFLEISQTHSFWAGGCSVGSPRKANRVQLETRGWALWWWWGWGWGREVSACPNEGARRGWTRLHWELGAAQRMVASGPKHCILDHLPRGSWLSWDPGVSNGLFLLSGTLFSRF